MANEIDFDALVQKTIESNNAMDDFDHLYGHLFGLPAWLFIARGQFPDINPYVASNAQIAGGQTMIRAFTDTNRLTHFAQENNLMEKDIAGSEQVPILSIPTERIVDYLEQFIPQAIFGIWFNSDMQSDGFFAPLKQLRPIQEHLKNLGHGA